MLLHRLLLQIIRSEIFVADLQGFALDVSIVVCGIESIFERPTNLPRGNVGGFVV